MDLVRGAVDIILSGELCLDSAVSFSGFFVLVVDFEASSDESSEAIDADDVRIDIFWLIILVMLSGNILSLPALLY